MEIGSSFGIWENCPHSFVEGYNLLRAYLNACYKNVCSQVHHLNLAATLCMPIYMVYPQHSFQCTLGYS